MEIKDIPTKFGLKREKYEKGKLVDDEYNCQVSITTISLGEVLKNFGDMIVTLKAEGGITKYPERYKLNDLGIKISDKKSFQFSQNYDTSLHPKFNPTWIKRQFDFMKEHGLDMNELRKNRHNEYVHTVGIPVQELTLLIKDDEIGELAEDYFDGHNPQFNEPMKRVTKRDKEFFVTFVSAPCESKEDRMRIAEHKINTELIKNCGFKYSMLNCIFVINRSQVDSLPKKSRIPIIDWYNLRSLRSIVQRIKLYLGEYGLVKNYKMGEEEKLFLVSTER